MFVTVPGTTHRLKKAARLERILPSGFASSKLSIPGRAAATRRNNYRSGEREDDEREEEEKMRVTVGVIHLRRPFLSSLLN